MQKERHLLGLSGGKDSAALAVYMKNESPELDIDYYFCDTGSELPEVYDYMAKLEGYLGKRVYRLNPKKDFEHWLRYYRYYLPKPTARWCTKVMKIKPFVDWIKPSLEAGDTIFNYIAIRADEPNREGFSDVKGKFQIRYPFRENMIDRGDVLDILNKSGLGIPEYYKWRSRSGCTFCFYQRKVEWLGLKQRHPEEYEKAIRFEKLSHQCGSKKGFTWNEGETLEELATPGRAKQVKEEFQKRREKLIEKSRQRIKNPLDPENNDLDLDDIEEILGNSSKCVMCHK